MSARRFAFTLIAALGLPALASAGPISFGYSTGGVTVSPGAPGLEAALVPFQPPSPVFTFDPADGTPVTLPAVSAVPALLPLPGARDLHADGTTHWNNDGYFAVDVGLTDVASGESAALRFAGRAHLYGTYSTEAGWGGVTYFWFQDRARVTLGGNDYTVWGANHYEEGPARVNVWVGPDAPVCAAPEPGALALAALGLLPLALRLRRA